jgi:PhnB protein
MTAPAARTTIAPWLAVPDGAAAVDFYTAAFGAVETYRLEGDGGAVAVARLEIDGAPLWVQEEPGAHGGPAVRMIVTVADPDALFGRAVAAGASPVAEVAEAHGWRSGRVTDPFGHDWELARPL